MNMFITIPIEDLIIYVAHSLKLNAMEAREEGSEMSLEEDALLWCEELEIPPTTDYEVIAKARIREIYEKEVK